MEFTKMHGTGNDYIYIDGFKNNIDNIDLSKLSVNLSKRHFSVGSDGLIAIMPSNKYDFKMRMFNADGSEAQMCGNGVRCIGKYVYDYKLTDKEDISIETLAGEIKLHLNIEDDFVTSVKVNMGKPVFDPAKIPVLLDGEIVLERKVLVNGEKYKITCVSMGNPHAVVFLNDIDNLDLNKIGPLFENNELFPERINTEFIEVIDRDNIKMRVWERGSGETMACGTGACASVVASYLSGKTSEKVMVSLKGGNLFVEYNQDEETVYLTGPAEEVFKGFINI